MTTYTKFQKCVVIYHVFLLLLKMYLFGFMVMSILLACVYIYRVCA